MLPFKKKQSYTINCKQDLIMWINRRCYKCCNKKTSRIYFAWYSRKFLKVPYLFIINFKIFTNRSFVYKLYGTQFLNKLVTIMGTNICKIRASTKRFFSGILISVKTIIFIKLYSKSFPLVTNRSYSKSFLRVSIRSDFQKQIVPTQTTNFTGRRFLQVKVYIAYIDGKNTS